MTALYREFTLSNAEVWSRLQTLVRDNAKAMIEKGTPLRIIVTSEERKRNVEQNRRLWGHVYKCIVEQAWVNEEQFDAEVWHEFFARKFLPHDDVRLPNGEVVTRRKSTTELTVGEFTDFMQAVELYAMTDLGVQFE